MKRLTTRDESGYYHLRRGPNGGEINKITVVQHLGRLEDVALRPVSREQVERMRSGWITVAETNGKQYSKCAACQMGLDGLEDAYLFCPHCSCPLTDEAVEMVMERLEALHGET